MKRILTRLTRQIKSMLTFELRDSVAMVPVRFYNGASWDGLRPAVRINRYPARVLNRRIVQVVDGIDLLLFGVCHPRQCLRPSLVNRPAVIRGVELILFGLAL